MQGQLPNTCSLQIKERSVSSHSPEPLLASASSKGDVRWEERDQLSTSECAQQGQSEFGPELHHQ